MKKNALDKVSYREVPWTDHRRSVTRSARDAIERNMDVWKKDENPFLVYEGRCLDIEKK